MLRVQLWITTQDQKDRQSAFPVEHNVHKSYKRGEGYYTGHDVECRSPRKSRCTWDNLRNTCLPSPGFAESLCRL